MNLESQRLSFREITWKDLDAIHHLHSIPEVDQYNTLGLPNNINENKELIRPFIE